MSADAHRARSGEPRKRRTRSIDPFRLLVESVKDYAIFMLDPAGYVTTWNRGAERLNGYGADEIIGRHFSSFYTPEDAAAGRPGWLLERALAEGRIEDLGWRVRKDGKRFWADVVISPLFDDGGRHRGFAKVTRDLTERRRAEEERVRLAHMEEAVRLREEFMSVAAHELRTPLNALRLKMTAMSLLLSDPERELDRADSLSKVEAALRQIDRLGHLVSRLFDMSRLSHGRLELEKRQMDLVECVREAIAAARELHAGSRQEIRFRGPSEARGFWDRLRLDQVVSNLLDNAVHYGGGAPVEVVVNVDGRAASLDVIDAGPGVPAEDRPRIFERFGTGNGRSRPRGLGLGLYIARAIVEAHGGTIELKDSAGTGAHFQVRLPADSDGQEPSGGGI